MAQAKKDGAKPGIRTILYAQKAEAEHAKLESALLPRSRRASDHGRFTKLDTAVGRWCINTAQE